MGNTTRGTALLAALMFTLTACGGSTTPDGLARALDAAGVPLDGTTSAERYYDTVQGVCYLDGDYTGGPLVRGFGREENAESFARMLAGMDYLCPDQVGPLQRQVEAFAD